MKLEEVKSLILRSKLSDELLDAFAGCLKRVRSNYDRCQHCYTFAAELEKVDPEGSARLIVYGLEHYAETNFDRYRSYYNLGIIQELSGLYSEAKQSYLNAYAFSDNINLHLDLLRTELHLTHFHYSADMEQFYQKASAMDSFPKSMSHAAFYLLLGQAVLCIHHSDSLGLKNTGSALRCLLDGAGTDNKVNASGDAMQFLKTLGIS